jgi:hypothetical protein
MFLRSLFQRLSDRLRRDYSGYPDEDLVKKAFKFILVTNVLGFGVYIKYSDTNTKWNV